MEETEGQQDGEHHQVLIILTLSTTICTFLQIKLQSQYEEGITGVHLMNKYQQQYAMDEFVAGEDIDVANIDQKYPPLSGRLGPGEMGNGAILERLSIDENTKKELMYLDHAFNQYLSDIISVNRTLPDRRDEWCKQPSR